jgi:hypothetical protein
MFDDAESRTPAHRDNGQCDPARLASRGWAAVRSRPAPAGEVPGEAIYWDIDVAIEKGFFKDEGFAPES